jgi:quinol monooxygenase YgiN
MSRLAALALPAALLALLLAPTARAQTEGPAYVVIYVEVTAEAAQQALAAMRQYRAAVRKEEANRGIQLIQELGRPSRLAIVETWAGLAEFDAHDQGAAAMQLRESLKPIEIAPRDRRLHLGFAIGGGTLAGDGVYAVSHIDVNPVNRPKTEPILKQFAEDSRKDSGNISFDVYVQKGALNHFGSVAIWRDRRAFEAYENLEHTKAARAGLASLMGALYDERLYQAVE